MGPEAVEVVVAVGATASPLRLSGEKGLWRVVDGGGGGEISQGSRQGGVEALHK